MIPNLRTSAVVCGIAFGILIVTAVVGNLMPEAVRSGHLVQPVLRVVFFGALGVVGLAAIPLIVNAAFDAQPTLRAERRGRAIIVYVIWGLIGTGALIAVPAAIFSGAFGDEPVNAPTNFAGKAEAGIGMTVAAVRHSSTLPVDANARYPTLTSNGLFDFHIAGTATTFRNCRLLLVTTDAKDRIDMTDAKDRIDTIHVAIVPEHVSLPVLELFMETTAKQLATEGWRPLPSHDDFALGSTWLSLRSARVDDYKSGEAENAGAWIATIDLQTLKAYKR